MRKAKKWLLAVLVLVGVAAVGTTTLFVGAKFNDNIDNFTNDVKNFFNNDKEEEKTEDVENTDEEIETDTTTTTE